MKKIIILSIFVFISLLLSSCSLNNKSLSEQRQNEIVQNENPTETIIDNKISNQTENNVEVSTSNTWNKISNDNQKINKVDNMNNYINTWFNFQFNYPSWWKIINETKNDKVEGLAIIPKLYLKLTNTEDFEVRDFVIVLMVVSEKEYDMPGWMNFNEAKKIIKDINWNNIYISITAESLMWWEAYQDNKTIAEKDTALFNKHWNSILESIKPVK